MPSVTSETAHAILRRGSPANPALIAALDDPEDLEVTANRRGSTQDPGVAACAAAHAGGSMKRRGLFLNPFGTRW